MSDRKDPTGLMWVQAIDLIDEAERLHRRFFRPGGSVRSTGAWEPPVDIFENEYEFVIVVAMPGVPPDQIEVLIEGRRLIIRGARRQAEASGTHRLRQLEIPYGSFERRIGLPAEPLEVVAPKLTDGCLTVRLRRLSGGLR